MLLAAVVVFCLQSLPSARALCQNCVEACSFLPSSPPFEHLLRREGRPVVAEHRLHDSKQPAAGHVQNERAPQQIDGLTQTMIETRGGMEEVE